MKPSSKVICVATLSAACLLSLEFLGVSPSNQSQERRVIEAVNAALTLEQRAEEAAPFESRADLERFFRQGFGAGLAADMARFNWPHGADEAYPLPKTVHLLSFAGNEAVTYYQTPEPSLNPDKSNQYSIQKVIKEGGRWIVDEVYFSDKRPSFQHSTFAGLR